LTWAERIQKITERPEFQTSRVRIIDPSLIEGGEYDVDTDTYAPITNDGVIYPIADHPDERIRTGQARVIPLRDGNFSMNADQANPTTITAIRVQIPRTAATDIRLRRGVKVIVDYAPASHLTDRLFSIHDDLQGATAASRSFVAMADMDAEFPTGGYGETEALRTGYGE
jgi:hypothetical protein